MTTPPPSPDPFAQPQPVAGHPHYAAPAPQPGGMSVATARAIEYSIIGLCGLALVFVFQPFSLTLYGVGAGLVVLGGLAFNLVPLCRPGAPLKAVIRAGLIVLALVVVVAALAIASAWLYGLYLQSQ